MVRAQIAGWQGYPGWAQPLESVDRDEFLSARTGVADHTILECEEGVVAAHAHTAARANGRAQLAHENAPSFDRLTAIDLDPATLSAAIATIACAALSLLVCHGVRP